MLMPRWGVSHRPAFQSTLSVRRATSSTFGSGGYMSFQSTLSVRRATYASMDVANPNKFQSTLSVRRATQPRGVLLHPSGISIHALREESDMRLSSAIWSSMIFQSTLSVRRATPHPLHRARRMRFQSTLSVRRATHSNPATPMHKHT